MVIDDPLGRFSITSRTRSDNKDPPVGRLKRILITSLPRVNLCIKHGNGDSFSIGNIQRVSLSAALYR
jgi:hypothetical protein